jgi:hypothetical protein
MDVNLFEARARITTTDGMPARRERTTASSTRILPGNGSRAGADQSRLAFVHARDEDRQQAVYSLLATVSPFS